MTENRTKRVYKLIRGAIGRFGTEQSYWEKETVASIANLDLKDSEPELTIDSSEVQAALTQLESEKIIVVKGEDEVFMFMHPELLEERFPGEDNYYRTANLRFAEKHMAEMAGKKISK